jgi:hypothetical protein
MLRTISAIFVLTTVTFSCSQNQNESETSSANKPEASLNSDPDTFNHVLVADLYEKLAGESPVSYSREHLALAVQGIGLADLKAGKEVEKEILFEENCNCNCYDKIRIAYDAERQRYVLHIYEEFYEPDMDWCPESSWQYSFNIEDNQIIDLNLDFMAG